MAKEQEERKRYRSQQQVWKRAEKYYPSDQLKEELNAYSLATGEYKSELAVRLMRSFFAAKKKEGHYPAQITLLPQAPQGAARKGEETE